MKPDYRMTVEDVHEILKNAENKCLSYSDIIADFAMGDVPMDKYLIRVGIALGIMQADAVEGYEEDYSED